MERVFAMAWKDIYKLYVQKVGRKGRTQDELAQVLCWLTSHTPATLTQLADADTTLEGFFATARIHPNASLIKGVICGHRVEDIEDPLMQKIRYMDKLVDELAKGKAMEKILRS